jgi:hypothetical protein
MGMMMIEPSGGVAKQQRERDAVAVLEEFTILVFAVKIGENDVVARRNERFR